MDKIEQVQMIESHETSLVKHWQTRNIQMQKDRDLLNIIKVKETTDKPRWYTNEPKVFFDTARSLVSVNAPRFRLPIDNYNPAPDQKQKQNKVERLVLGIYRSLDQRVVDAGGASWLWDLAYWMLLGHVCAFNMVEKSPDGPLFRADIWDSMNVYPEWDEFGMKRCLRSYEVDEYTAQAMAVGFQTKGLEFQYEQPKDGGKCKVINYWYREMAKGKPRVWNAITLNGVLVKPMTLQKLLTRIPVHYLAVGSPDKVSEGWQERKGESILYADRDMFEYRNIMISLMAEILAATAYPNIVTKTKTGRAPFKQEDVRGHGSELPLQLGEEVDLLKHAATPEEASYLMNWTGQKVQEGALPATVYGSVPFELSGFAISQYMATLKYKLGPYLNAMQYILGRIMTDFLLQYRSGNYGNITLSTGSPGDLRRGMCYFEEFTKEDVPERIYVEVTIPISSQFDKTQQILNARQALQAPQIYSLETIWEMDGDVQDFEVERERIKRDMVENDPFIVGMDIIAGLMNRAMEYEAKGDIIKAQALKKYIMLKEMEMGMRQGIPQRPGQSAAGIPPNQMPPEARNSPDQTNAMMGKGPSGVSRRVQTPEERAAGQGRRGVLVNPAGQPLS